MAWLWPQPARWWAFPAIHMGQVDIEKEHPNVTKMRILGCNLVPVTRCGHALKEAVDSAFEVYLQDPVNTIYAIGSVVGPHPFPMMVRDFQSIMGREAREQFQAKHGRLPDHVAACVGGGSNAMGIFTAFLDDASVHLVGVEPAGEGVDKPGRHAATITMGKPGEIHGMKCYVLENEDGTPAAVHSIASGLDYPGVGPQHSYLKDIGRVDYQSVGDKECLDAFMTIARGRHHPRAEAPRGLGHARSPKLGRTSTSSSTSPGEATGCRLRGQEAGAVNPKHKKAGSRPAFCALRLYAQPT